MFGVVLTGHGGPEKLVARDDLPVPVPGAGEVLVRVSAAGVNNTDINTRVGWYARQAGNLETASWAGDPIQFPRIQGIDVCGFIAAVGDRVDTARVGERVLIEPCLRDVGGQTQKTPWFLGSECDGGFAEFVVVSQGHAHPVRSAMSDVELASFPCSYSTAENILTRCRVTREDTVLVTGASGGVGSAAIQLAKARGASVIAVTSPGKFSDIEKLGADRTIARDGALDESDGVDVVVDLVAGSRWAEYLSMLRPGGRYGVSGAIGGPIVELDVRTLYLKDLSFFGCTVLEPEVFPNLVRLIEDGRIRPLVAATYPLRDIAKAQAAFLEKKHVGKIVLTVSADATRNRS